MDISLLVASLIAGALTILAPCVVPILPIILGGSAGEKNRLKPIIITASLGVSIVVFTLLIRLSANAFGVSPRILTYFSGGILVLFGVATIFPELWERASNALKLNTKSNKLMGKYVRGEGFLSEILLGASLGPVFASCSPTYAAILALAVSGEITNYVATIYLTVYAIGLSIMLLLIAFMGQRIVGKLGWATDPKGWFKRSIGILFLLVGLLVLTGFDKEIEAWLLEQGIYDPIAEFENDIRE